MDNCKRCCRKCFPGGCCGFCAPPPQKQQQVDVEIHLKANVEKKDTPYGWIDLYPGVRTADNSYTSPMLAIHLYRLSQRNADKREDERTIVLDHKNQQQSHEGPQQLTREEKDNTEEELIMLPLEDITLINSKSEIKRGKQADIKTSVEPVYELSENCCDRCWASVRNYCCCCQQQIKIAPLVRHETVYHNQDPRRRANVVEKKTKVTPQKEGCCTTFLDRFRCWCCRKKILTHHIERTNTLIEEKAERVITVTIEYSKYSHLDSASNARLLANQDQLAY